MFLFPDIIVFDIIVPVIGTTVLVYGFGSGFLLGEVNTPGSAPAMEIFSGILPAKWYGCWEF